MFTTALITPQIALCLTLSSLTSNDANTAEAQTIVQSTFIELQIAGKKIVGHTRNDVITPGIITHNTSGEEIFLPTEITGDVPGIYFRGKFIPGAQFDLDFYPGIFVNGEFLPGVILEVGVESNLSRELNTELAHPHANTHSVTFVPGMLSADSFIAGDFRSNFANTSPGMALWKAASLVSHLDIISTACTPKATWKSVLMEDVGISSLVGSIAGAAAGGLIKGTIEGLATGSGLGTLLFSAAGTVIGIVDYYSQAKKDETCTVTIENTTADGKKQEITITAKATEKVRTEGDTIVITDAESKSEKRLEVKQDQQDDQRQKQDQQDDQRQKQQHQKESTEKDHKQKNKQDKDKKETTKQDKDKKETTKQDKEKTQKKKVKEDTPTQDMDIFQAAKEMDEVDPTGHLRRALTTTNPSRSMDIDPSPEQTHIEPVAPKIVDGTIDPNPESNLEVEPNRIKRILTQRNQQLDMVINWGDRP